MPYEVIRLDRETALGSVAEIRQAVLEAGEGNLDWPRIPVEIDDLDQLADVLEGWGVSRKPSQLDVQRALDRHAVWVGGVVAVSRLKTAPGYEALRHSALHPTTRPRGLGATSTSGTR